MWYFGWLFITLVAFSVLGILISERRNSLERGWFFDCLNIISGTTLFLTIICWIVMFFWDLNGADHKMDSYDPQSIVSDTTFIKSASLNSEIHGEFVLGCGSIDSEDVYKFYKIVDNNSFKLMTLPVAKSRIQEVELDSTFVPVTISYYYTEGYTNHCRFYRLMLNKRETEIFHDIKHLKEHVIYVPKGTIVGDLSKLNL